MRPTTLVVAVCGVFLIGGFLLKAPCMSDWAGGIQYERLCYNDIQPLWGVRGIEERTFPYIDGALEDGELVDGAIEYPVLTGVFMWASGTGSGNASDYLRVSALLLAPFGLLVAYLLSALRGHRALLWAAAPALVLYAFHNWDLLVVACAVGGFYLWYRGRPVGAAAAFGLGAAFKMYPIFFLAPLALESLAAGRRRVALAVAGAGAGVVALANLPFIVANVEGWWATYHFHRVRGPNYDTIWAVREFPLGLPRVLPFDLASGLEITIPDLDPHRLNVVTAVLTAAAFLGALTWGWVRARRERAYPVVEVSAALVAAFLLFNKVHSPQYTLWLLPFFVLVPVGIGWWIAYSAVDLMVYVGVFRFFFDFLYRGLGPGASAAYDWMVDGVFYRAVLLAALYIVFLRAPPRVASHPIASVTPVGDSGQSP